MDNQIAIDLYNNLGNINRHTIRSEHRSMMRDIKDGVGFLLFNMKHYDARYVISLLLSFPSLLLTLKADDWIRLIRESFPKKKIATDQGFKNINDDGEFFDLIFLHRYLDINPFYILAFILQIEKSELANCIKFFKMYEYKFFNREEIHNDLLEFYSINKDELVDYRSILIKSGFQKGFQNGDDMEKYIQALLE